MCWKLHHRRMRRVGLGRYPDVLLEKARKIATQHRGRIFDGADPDSSIARRTSSIVPLQALYMMNDPFVQERATGLASRLIAASHSPHKRIKMGCELAWGRPPTPGERKKFGEYIKRFKLALSATDVAPDKLDLETWSSFAHVLISSNEFVYVD